MLKSKLKSFLSSTRKVIKLVLLVLAILLLVALMAFVGSKFIPAAKLPSSANSISETAGNGTAIPEGTQPALSSQFEAPKTLTDAREILLADQVKSAAAGREDVLAFTIYDVAVDSIDFSKDGKLALVWISLVDKETGLVQPGEPGLVIATQRKDPGKPWKLTFQADANFAEVLAQVPTKLLSNDVKQLYMPAIQKVEKSAQVFTGYRLPWPKGQEMQLTGSIGHVYTYKSCPSTCLYAFDFANGSMFNVVAAKQGTVKYAVWKYENGDPKNANYIVLEDTTTVPTTYQVYLHLAQNSIPVELRKVGARVVQGQLLGRADDTGYSTGNHLHFHVHTNPDSYWGKSVDIVFEDVTVNGGRPRMCSESKAYPQLGDECMPQDKYISNNGDTESPTGGITSPEAGNKIKAPTVNVTGWMKDDVGVYSGQLYYKTGSKWQPIGKEIKKANFSRTVDLCEAGIPDGPFSLGIVVTDNAGNVSSRQGEITLEKKYTCPAQPPACKPAADEVALYSAVDFQGACQVLDIGDYPNMDELPEVKSDQALSIQVGANVTAALYPDNNFTGTMEAFQDGDNDLGNNPIGAANAASLKVVPRVLTPAPAVITLPESIDTETNLTVEWSVETGTESKATLKGPSSYENALDWQSGASWKVGPLEKGNYTLTVEVRNLVGIATTTQEFKVVNKVLAPETHMEILPQGSKSTVVKLAWVVDSRALDVDHFELQYREGDKGDWLTWSEPIDARSREMLFWTTPDKLYEFRIRAVGKDGAEEAFTGKPEASTYILPDCADDAYEGTGTGDDKRTTAPTVTYGETQTHNWCQLGDIDWMVFEAKAGDPVTLHLQPIGTGAAGTIRLFPADSNDALAEVTPDNLDKPTTLSWTAPADGIYAVKLVPADNRIAGEDATYEFSIMKRSTVKASWFLVIAGIVSALLGGGFFVQRRVQAKKAKKGVGW